MVLRDMRKLRNGVSEALTLDPLSPIVAKNPEMYECLCGYSDEKGKHVPGCKITIFHEMGNLKIAINDPVTGRVGFGVLDPGQKLSQAIEELCGGSGLEWRVSGGKRG